MEVEPEGDVEAGGPVETHASDFPGKDGTCAQVSSVSSSPCGHLDAAALRNGHSVFTPGSNAVLSSQFPSSPPSSSPSSSPSSPSASCLGTREKSDSRSLTSGHLNGSAADAESPGTRGGDSAVSRDGREDSMGKLQMLLEYGESYLLSLCHHSRKQEATRQFSASREAVESGAASGLGPCGEKAVGSGPSRRSRRVVSSDDEDGPDFEEGKSGEDARRARKRRRGPEEGSPYLEEEFRSRPVITRLSTHPSILRCPPKPYQLEGLNWLIQLHERGMNGILADEMGLGKTYQTISLLAFLKEGKGVDGPHLVLAPKSTIGNWMTEFRKFCPSINAVRVLGDKETRRRTLAHIVSRTQASSFPFSFPGEKTLRSESSPESEEEKSDDETQKDLKGAERPDEDGEEGAKEEKEEDDGVLPDRVDVVVTSFEMCILERAQFLKVDWEYIIIDEAHRIKNESSKLAQTARLFNTKHRLLLTGTPLQNNLRELWALLNFLFPSLFSSSAEFEHLFDLTGTGEAGSEMTAEEREERNMKIVTRLHRILRPFMLRRVKKEVLKEMPPKKELLLVVPLSAMQKQLYKDLLTKNVAALQGAEGAGRTQLLNLAMQLRKACNHPYLFDGYESEHADPFGEHVIENAGKLRFCDRLLRRLIQENRRCLIFTQMTKMIDILEDYCRIRLFKYCRIDGNTSGDERDRQIEAFNAPGSDIPIFLLSTRAGGLGINLATADTVILYDSDWNPQVDLQAMDRVHRIGQKSAVNVYRLVHEHTIEQKIIERAMLKLQLDTAIIQQGRLSDQQNQQKQLSKNELMTMVQFGADHIFKSGAGEDVTEEELEAILARGQERTDAMNEKLQAHVKKSLLDFTINSAPSSSLYEYDGIDYTDQQRKADREAWASLAVQTLEAQNERESRRRIRMQKEQEMQLQQSAEQRKVKHVPRAVRLPAMQEWQFYDRRRIEELHAVELMYYRNQGTTRAPTDEEREEKQRLLREGFGSWGKRDFIQFVKGNEMYGRHDIARIATEVDGKSVEEVAAYSRVFWSRYPEIQGWEKWIRRIEEGEAVINKRRELEQVIVRRQQQCEVPWRRLLIPYGGAAKSRSIFTEQEDRWILNMTTLLGYGNWDKMRDLLLRDTQWRLDWFVRSRTAGDVGKRAEALVRLLKKEEGERFTRGRRRLDLPDTRPTVSAPVASAPVAGVSPAAGGAPGTAAQSGGDSGAGVSSGETPGSVPFLGLGTNAGAERPASGRAKRLRSTAWAAA
ncbi:SWI2/SNF2 ISWI-like SANT [Toxoplasma gondii GT1]|uniref:SWI/SNF-related matrix-associated actin-dependent regulator of chromatin, putative n=10 Tax=Toxoplasma gondii TaxID=5811 RepID=A0A125YKZ7_TOXGV|nr:SWI2/SNF2 ISWI-like SANT [Toxoplasma gondii GT1]ESS29580.1 SWI2/SNF2 ISWI-like SANT [Toxoplasma gondii VEG]KAF4645809.1 SWI2/SNF2 ISWI-like SANT [Toxoplasma gondii]PUA83785.1 SWI2/SNF2 ISWI-like SANT [Toxoplasma gondii TgCATBr9]CEL71826.1 TPA: SWI/SNF-related matrix-associated actin-dependent regulator of chromatin, putative [Toxoplasma gondii VEG]